MVKIRGSEIRQLITRTTLILLIITSTLASASPVQQVHAEDPSFGSLIKLSNSREYADLPDLAVSDNAVYVVWSQHATQSGGTLGNGDIFFTRRTDNLSSFGDMINLSKNDGKSDYPQIAANGNNVYVVWQDDSRGSKEILFRRSTDNGASFSSVINLSNNSGDSELPEIAVTGNNVYVIWRDYSLGNYEIFLKRSTNGISFSDVINLSSDTADSWLAELPELAVFGSNVYVVWSQDDIFLRRSTDNGISFDPEVNVSNTSGSSHHPAIAASDDNVYVVWFDDTHHGGHGADYGIYFAASKDNGANFGNVVILSENSGEVRSLQTAGSANNAYVVWSDGTFPQLDVLFKRSNDNGDTFDSAINLSNAAGVSKQPQIVISGNNVYVVWQDNDDIFFRLSKDNGATFGKAINLSNDGKSSYPQIAVSGNDVYVAWIDNGQIAFRTATIKASTPTLPPNFGTPKITIGSVSNLKPRWGLDTVTVSGTVTNALGTDTITVDWGDGTSKAKISHSKGSWGPVSHTYDSAHIGTKQIVTKLFATRIEKATSNPYAVDVQKHKTSLTISPIPSVELGSDITVTGSLFDLDAKVGITGRIITFDGTGAAGLSRKVTFAGGSFSAKGASPSNATTELTVQAHFAGDDLYLASDSSVQNYDTLEQTVAEAERRVQVSDITLVDITGNKLIEVPVGMRVLVQGNLENEQSQEQPLTYIVQIKNELGETAFLSWIKGSLQKGQSIDAAVGWIPESPGNYTVEIFVWVSINNPQPLSEVYRIKLTAS